MNFLTELIRNLLLAAVPAMGFGMLFQVPPRLLGYCAAGGALGLGLRFSLVALGLPLEWATFLAATAVSSVGIFLASRLRAHPKVFTVAAMIPMVPGVPLYTAVIAVATIQRSGYSAELMSVAVAAGLKAIVLTFALAVGLAFPGMLLYRTRPVI